MLALRARNINRNQYSQASLRILVPVLLLVLCTIWPFRVIDRKPSTCFGIFSRMRGENCLRVLENGVFLYPRNWSLLQAPARMRVLFVEFQGAFSLPWIPAKEPWRFGFCRRLQALLTLLVDLKRRENITVARRRFIFGDYGVLLENEVL